MTTSGTYDFSLNSSSIILESFDRIGIRSVEITREQMSSAIRSINLELQSWSNDPVMLWEISLVTFPLVQGTATYVFDQSVQMIADGFVTLVQSGNPPIDRILVSISRDEYASYSSKQSQGAPSVFWFQRLPTPQVTLYLVPDGTSETTVSFYVMKRVQDVVNGQQSIDIPYRFLDALAARLAVRLAVKYAKDQLPILQPLATEAYNLAHYEDKERATLYVTPDFSSYSVD